MPKPLLLWLALLPALLLAPRSDAQWPSGFSELSHDTSRVDVLLRAAREISETDTQTAQTWANHAGVLLSSTDLVRKEKYCFTQGIVAEYRSALDSAIYWYEQAVALALKRGDEYSALGYEVAKGAACYFAVEYGRALYHFDRALTEARRQENLSIEAKVLNNMAIIYRYLNDFDQAVTTYRRSIEVKEQLGDTAGLAVSLFNLGKAFYMLDEPVKSETELARAAELAELLGDTLFMAEVDAERGITALELGNIDDATRYFDRAYPIIYAARSYSLLSATMGRAAVHQLNGETDLALAILDENYDFFKNRYNDKLRQGYERVYAAALESAGRLQEALHHQRLYTELRLEELTERRERFAAEMQARFETKEKEGRIKLQGLELAEASRRRTNLVLSLLVAGVLLLGAVVVVVLKIRNHRLLRAEQARTEAALRDRETLLREIHHRVKNNLQIVSSLLSIQGREITDQKAQAAVNDSRNRVQSMALIHRFLYGEEHLNSIDMHEYVSHLCTSLLTTYSLEGNRVSIRHDVAPIRLDVDTAIPVGLILNELITNALKYAFPDHREGHIEVVLHEYNQKLYLKVSDNGVGASGDAPSSSFGMKLLNAFKARLGAEFRISGDSGVSVTYEITKYRLA